MQDGFHEMLWACCLEEEESKQKIEGEGRESPCGQVIITDVRICSFVIAVWGSNVPNPQNAVRDRLHTPTDSHTHQESFARFCLMPLLLIAYLVGWNKTVETLPQLSE